MAALSPSRALLLVLHALVLAGLAHPAAGAASAVHRGKECQHSTPQWQVPNQAFAAMMPKAQPITAFFGRVKETFPDLDGPLGAVQGGTVETVDRVSKGGAAIQAKLAEGIRALEVKRIRFLKRPEVRKTVRDAMMGVEAAKDSAFEALKDLKDFTERQREEVCGKGGAFELYQEMGDQLFEDFSPDVAVRCSVNARSAAVAAQGWCGNARKWIQEQHVDLGAVGVLAARAADEVRSRRPWAELRRAVPPLDIALYECSARWRSFEIERPLRAQQLWNAGAGASAYLSTIAAGQRACGALALSVVSKKAVSRASMLGFATVALAGVIGGEAAHFASEWRRARVSPYVLERMSPSMGPRTNAQRMEEVAMSLAFYKLLLGGRFRNIAPSDLRHPGAFASEFIPARGEQYAGYRERTHIQKIGRKMGCHSCGSRLPGGFMGLTKKWVADHQPPNKLVSMGEAQRFYPHCVSCSLKQSAVLRGAANPLTLHFATPAAILASASLAIRPAFEAAGDAWERTLEAFSDAPPRPRPVKRMQHREPPKQPQKQPQRQPQRQTPRPAAGGRQGKQQQGRQAVESPSARFERPPPMPEPARAGAPAASQGGFDWDAADRYDARDKRRKVAF